MITLDLFGEVGVDFDTASVKAALRDGGDVTVNLNSGGGYAAEGAAIHALLSAHPGKIRVEVIGIAASAASLIAMAGDAIIMADGAVLMIHDPMNITMGNSADHQKTIEELETYARAYARIYAKRAGISESAAREIMKTETWYDGPQALKAGFATATTSRTAAPWARYDYQRYQKGTEAVAAASGARGSWKKALMRHQAHEAAFVVKG